MLTALLIALLLSLKFVIGHLVLLMKLRTSINA